MSQLNIGSEPRLNDIGTRLQIIGILALHCSEPKLNDIGTRLY